MVSFFAYDVTLLILFSIAVFIFLYVRRHNLTRQGIIYLYKTQLGIKFIDTVAKKYKRILRPLQYLILVSGYTLMIAVSWMIAKSVYVYLRFFDELAISAPPIAPLIPYFPRVFGLESLFPPLYFTYFIIALTIVAVVHEFSHGIIARLHNFKIHSTGFVFLGPILGAFVEPDEKQMSKAKKFPQLAILAAGTFANIVAAVLFSIVMALFFITLFSPSGVVIGGYNLAVVNVNDVSIVGGHLTNENLVEITAGGVTYFAVNGAVEKAREEGVMEILAWEDSPGLRAGVRVGEVIVSIDDSEITDLESYYEVVQSYRPGETATIHTIVKTKWKNVVIDEKQYDLEFEQKNGETFLGPEFNRVRDGGGIVGFVYRNFIAPIKEPGVYYSSDIGNIGWFVNYLLFWIVVINLLVALFNMLPLGILDGGRFFLLTVWGLTGSERIGKGAYKIATWTLILALFTLMARWAFGFL